MKSLDQMLSVIVSPFDETGQDQIDLTMDQYLQYRMDALIEILGKKKSRNEFDLYFSDVLEELESDRRTLFVRDLIDRLNEIYPIDVLYDYINTENLIETNIETLIELVKFFAYDKWQDVIIDYLPTIDIHDLNNKVKLAKQIKDSYDLIQTNIISNDDIHDLIKYHFNYCTSEDGRKTIVMWILKDLVGVISKQIVIQNTKGNSK